MKRISRSEKLLFIIVALFLFSLPNLLEEHAWRSIPVFFRMPSIQTFTIFLLAIVLEALPFILIGSTISGLIEVYLHEEKIFDFFHRKRLLPMVLIAGLLGLVAPVCECGIIPVVRRLLKKGVPFSVAVTYMLTGPIVNVTVIASTSLAFWKDPKVIFWRPVLAYLVGVTIGLTSVLFKNKTIFPEQDGAVCAAQDHCRPPAGGHGHDHDHSHDRSWLEVFHHAGDDFFLMGKYLVFGALVASLIQTAVPRQSIEVFTRNLPLSILGMMLLGFLLDLCSEADAFVASSFVQFSSAAKIAFLVSGPMLDLKMVLMFLCLFRKKYIIFLSAAIVGLVFIMTYILGTLLR